LRRVATAFATVVRRLRAQLEAQLADSDEQRCVSELLQHVAARCAHCMKL
jgi:hypothetical protein